MPITTFRSLRKTALWVSECSLRSPIVLPVMFEMTNRPCRLYSYIIHGPLEHRHNPAIGTLWQAAGFMAYGANQQ